MISRLAAAGSALLALVGGLYVWGLARSPDSGWRVGLVLAVPMFGFALALGLLAYWTRRGSDPVERD